MDASLAAQLQSAAFLDEAGKRMQLQNLYSQGYNDSQILGAAGNLGFGWNQNDLNYFGSKGQFAPAPPSVAPASITFGGEPPSVPPVGLAALAQPTATQPPTAAPTPAPAPSYTDAEVKNYVDNILNNQSYTSADRARLINEAAGNYGIDRNRLSQATGYNLNDVNYFLDQRALADLKTAQEAQALQKQQESLQSQQQQNQAAISVGEGNADTFYATQKQLEDVQNKLGGISSIPAADRASILQRLIREGDTQSLAGMYGPDYNSSLQFLSDLGVNRQGSGLQGQGIVAASPTGYSGAQAFDPIFGSSYFKQPLETFGKSLGLSPTQIASISGNYMADTFYGPEKKRMEIAQESPQILTDIARQMLAKAGKNPYDPAYTSQLQAIGDYGGRVQDALFSKSDTSGFFKQTFKDIGSDPILLAGLAAITAGTAGPALSSAAGATSGAATGAITGAVGGATAGGVGGYANEGGSGILGGALKGGTIGAATGGGLGYLRDIAAPYLPEFLSSNSGAGNIQLADAGTTMSDAGPGYTIGTDGVLQGVTTATRLPLDLTPALAGIAGAVTTPKVPDFYRNADGVLEIGNITPEPQAKLDDVVVKPEPTAPPVVTSLPTSGGTKPTPIPEPKLEPVEVVDSKYDEPVPNLPVLPPSQDTGTNGGYTDDIPEPNKEGAKDDKTSVRDSVPDTLKPIYDILVDKGASVATATAIAAALSKLFDQKPQAGYTSDLAKTQAAPYQQDLSAFQGKRAGAYQLNPVRSSGLSSVPLANAGYAEGGPVHMQSGDFVFSKKALDKVGGIAELRKRGYPAEAIKGPGTGTSDSIPATIDGEEPARVANGEALIRGGAKMKGLAALHKKARR